MTETVQARTYMGRSPRGPLAGCRIYHGYFAQIPAMFQPEFAAISAAFEEPFRGITTDGRVRTDVLTYDAGGVSTAPIVEAARAFLDAVDQPDQRAYALQPFDSPDRRRWVNAFFHWMPPGLYLDDVGAAQREAALKVIAASVSPEGFDEIRATDVAISVRDELELETKRTLDRASRWLLSNRPQPIAVCRRASPHRAGHPDDLHGPGVPRGQAVERHPERTQSASLGRARDGR